MSGVRTDESLKYVTTPITVSMHFCTTAPSTFILVSQTQLLHSISMKLSIKADSLFHEHYQEEHSRHHCLKMFKFDGIYQRESFSENFTTYLLEAGRI